MARRITDMRNRLRASTLDTFPGRRASHDQGAIFRSPPETDFLCDRLSRTCTSHSLTPAPLNGHPGLLAELLANQSIKLTNVATESLGEALASTLQSLVEFLGAERGCLAETAPSGTLVVAMEYCLAECLSFPPTLLEVRHA